MFHRTLCLLVLLPTLAFSYTVVRKDGRPFSGELVREDKEFVIIRESGGIEVKFRVDQLDAERTKAANSGAPQTQTSTQPTAPKRFQSESASRWSGEPITMDFKDIDIKDFFRFIADLSGMNLILDPDVKGSVTVKLTEVPWDQALDLVCRMNGLGYEIEGNALSVKK